MFSNRFNTKNDPLIEAVQSAMQDGEIRRQAEALVNEEFGVYSRKAVVREQLAAYDARLEEAYKCMKEGQKLADKDYDKDGKIESPKDEVWGSRFRAAKKAGKMEEEQIDEISKGLARRYRDKAHADYTYSAGKRSDDEFVSGPGKKMTDVSGKLKFKERSKEAQKADDKTIQKRLKGLGMAHKRLSKEETQIDEISRHTLMSYRNKAAKQVMDIKKKGWSTEKDRDTVQKREIGHSLAGDKMRVRVAASYNKGYSPEDLAKHGGRGGAAPKKKMDEAQIDEVSAGLAQRAAHRAFVKSDKMKADAKKEPDMHSYVQAVHKGEKKSKQGTKFAKYAAKKMEEGTVTSDWSGSKMSDKGHPGVYHGDVSYKSSAERMKSGRAGADPHETGMRKVDEKKMYEGMMDPKDPSVQGSGDVTSTPVKHVRPTNPERIKSMKDPRDPSVQGSGDVTSGGRPASIREALKEAIARKKGIAKGGVTAPQEFKQERFANAGAVTKAPVPGASILEDEQVDEAAYSAKAARAGKDIGKPGKMFKKIASKAGERYGSEERGRKVAGAILAKIRAKHMKEEQSF